MAYSPAQRAAAIETVLAGLRKGTPLTVLCSAKGMPNDDTIRDWAEADEGLSRDIARAREQGFDQIAVDILTITDTEPERMATEVGDKVDPGYVQHQKNRAEMRLKLLSKWDPKRYGEKIQHTGDGGGSIAIRITPEDAAL